MPDIVWTSVFTSSVIAAILGGLIGGIVTLRVARNQYLNDYYKTILRKRLAAYEQIEGLIIEIKLAVTDEGGHGVYHFLFSSGDSVDIYKKLYFVFSQSMWLSEDMLSEILALNRLIRTFPDDKQGIIAHAKSHYKTIAEIRTRLEHHHRKDLLALHNVKGFLRSKGSSDSYQPLPSRGQQKSPTDQPATGG